MLRLLGCYRGVETRKADSDSALDSESENDGVLVSEGEELGGVDESAFGKLMTGAIS